MTIEAESILSQKAQYEDVENYTVVSTLYTEVRKAPNDLSCHFLNSLTSSWERKDSGQPVWEWKPIDNIQYRILTEFDIFN